MVYVPTVAQTEAGYYLDIDPVNVICAADIENLSHAIKRVISIGNPKVVTPTRTAFPKPVVLNYARVSSWAAFEMDMECCEINESKGVYQIHKSQKDTLTGCENNPVKVISLPPNTGIDSVARSISTLVQSVFSSSQSKNTTQNRNQNNESEVGT